jgi:hypothetical protein
LEGLAMENLGIFMTIWSILRPLEIFYDHLEYFEAIWYIFPLFGILDQEKSGNPVLQYKIPFTFYRLV